MPTRKRRSSEADAAASSAETLPHLVIHFDVNETIMIGDPAGGDTYDDCCHKVIAKVAYVKPNPAPAASRAGRWSDYVWHDGSSLDPLLREPGAAPPPLLFAWQRLEGTTPVYSVKELKKPFAKCFAAPGSPGEIYAAEFTRLRDALRWPADAAPDARLSQDGFHTFLPAFFHTLSELSRSGRPFSIVLRTFGTDLPHVAQAINAFADGEHPLWRGQKLPQLRLEEEDLWEGRYQAGSGVFTLSRGAATAAASAAATVTGGGGGAGCCLETELEVEAELRGGGGPCASSTGSGGSAGNAKVASRARAKRGPARGGGGGSLAGGEVAVGSATVGSVHGVGDHYDYWKAAGYSPSAGKPLFWTLDDTATHTLFFDDNIHNDANDSIVAVRARRDGASPFAPLSGESTRRLHGALLRKVPTVLPILDRGWFLQELAASEAAVAELRKQTMGSGLLDELRASLPT